MSGRKRNQNSTAALLIFHVVLSLKIQSSLRFFLMTCLNKHILLDMLQEQ